MPRLEGLLDIAYQTLGAAGLEVLDGYRNVTPNRFHKLYAWHLQNGGHHVTANFDVGIELADAVAGVADATNREDDGSTVGLDAAGAAWTFYDFGEGLAQVEQR